MAASNLNNVIKDVTGAQSSALAPQVQAEELKQQVADKLHYQLSNCQPTTDWQDYQKICASILDFSLREVLRSTNIKEEVSSWDSVQRMDLVLANLPARSVGFFHDRLHGDAANFLIFECKNYKDGIGPNEVLQAKSYEIRGAEKIRFILTRKLPKDNAIKAIRHWYHYYSIKILVLTDEEMHKLIDAALLGPDDVEKVFDSIFTGDRQSWYFG